MSVSEICDSIYRLYISNPGLPYLDSRVLASYQEVKDHIVYKLINTQANAAFLKRLPHMEFQDMSLVCYLLMAKLWVMNMKKKQLTPSWKLQKNSVWSRIPFSRHYTSFRILPV